MRMRISNLAASNHRLRQIAAVSFVSAGCFGLALFPLKLSASHANVISSSAITQLEAIASNSASGDGDPSPVSALAVLTTAQQALIAISSDDTGMPGLESTEPVYLISMTGNFTGYTAYIPPGAAFPTGTEIDIVVDAKSFDVLTFALKPTTTTDIGALATPTSLNW